MQIEIYYNSRHNARDYTAAPKVSGGGQDFSGHPASTIKVLRISHSE